VFGRDVKNKKEFKMKEIWKTIKDFEDYAVSNMGRVKSLKFGKERILKPGRSSSGYLIVILCRNKKQYIKTIHRLVLENFNPIDNMDKFECNHENGIKTENIYPDNLEWVTSSENMEHAIEVGLINNKGKNNSMFGKHPSDETRKKQSEKKKGENHPQSILTEKNIIEIRIDLEEGKLTQKEIAKKFGVKQPIISRIKLRKSWSHI